MSAELTRILPALTGSDTALQVWHSSKQCKASEQQILNLNEAFERLGRELGNLKIMECRSVTQPGEVQELSSEQRKASEQQIFNLNEAFERLSRELGDLMRMPVPGVSVQAVGDDVYLWAVKLTFPSTCELGRVRTLLPHEYCYQ